jgi:hypothetical protein
MTSPEIRFGALSMWVGRSQSPCSRIDPLHIEARVNFGNTSTAVPHAFACIEDFDAFCKELWKLQTRSTDQATLECLRSTLTLSLRTGSGSSVAVRLGLAPEDVSLPSEDFCFHVERSALKPLIADCRRVVFIHSQF